jgi:hypothetical protein
MSDTTAPTHHVQPYDLADLDTRIAEGSVDPNRLAATVQGMAQEMEQFRETTTAVANWINARVQAEQGAVAGSAGLAGKKGK